MFANAKPTAHTRPNKTAAGQEKKKVFGDHRYLKNPE